MDRWVSWLLVVAFLRLQLVCCCGAVCHFDSMDTQHAHPTQFTCACKCPHLASPSSKKIPPAECDQHDDCCHHPLAMLEAKIASHPRNDLESPWVADSYPMPRLAVGARDPLWAERLPDSSTNCNSSILGSLGWLRI